MKRRKFLFLAAGAAAFPSLPRFASAFDYPTRPVHLVAGFPPGGIVDLMARMISQELSERLGQRFVVENRTGAGGAIAAEYVAKANPDGYTLLLTNAADAWNASIYNNLNFDYLRDITPVASIERASGVMEVNLSVPANSVTEFIAYAKANPGKINMASAGPGSGPHIYGELFKSMAGVDLVTVHYRGGGPALPDLISGRVQVMFDPIASSIGYLRAGKLRPLGVTAARRVAVLPDVPTIGEFVPGYEASGWSGIGAPANTPPEIIAILNKEVTATLANPVFKSRLLDLGVEAFASRPAEFSSFVIDFTAKWAKVIRAAGIKIP
jgi:tripartite-type tricarboxylate transporter receptor subunit TctC